MLQPSDVLNVFNSKLDNFANNRDIAGYIRTISSVMTKKPTDRMVILKRMFGYDAELLNTIVRADGSSAESTKKQIRGLTSRNIKKRLDGLIWEQPIKQLTDMFDEEHFYDELWRSNE